MRLIDLFKKGLMDLLYPYSFDVRPGATKGGFYYLDISNIVTREIWGFRQGIPITRHGHHNPVTVSFYALHVYDKYLAKEERSFTKFLDQARWLQSQQDKGAFIYYVPVLRYAASGSWRSAMAQGLAISVFTRAYKLTHESQYLATALQAAEVLSKPIEAGGCASFDTNGLPFLEEVAVNPPAHILNGAIFALWGLYDLELISNDYCSFKDLVIKRLIKELPHYDLSYWSRYDLMYQAPASRGYHLLHIAQLKVLYRLTGKPVFKHYADKWQSYLGDPLKRLRAFARRAWFSMVPRS